MLILFATTSIVSALLLFFVQPMFAKMALPLLGGSPAVWTTCMVFFQATLLAGYAYAHVVTTRLNVRSQVVLHTVVLLLPFLVLPIGIVAGSAPAGEVAPVLWLLGVMTTTLALPFFAVATSAPLLQRWFSYTSTRDPYRLYAAGNAGSLVALLSYPLLAEPLLTLRLQSLAWRVGYDILFCLLLACAVQVWRLHPSRIAGTAERTSIDTALTPGPTLAGTCGWLLRSAVPSSLMLAVTAYLSTDIAAVPLLWIAPLALYLLTFIIAFSGHADRAVAIARVAVPPLILPLAVLMMTEAVAYMWFVVALHLATFFAIALGCHARLAADRPPAQHLTSFYLWMAAGGLLGGVFNSIVAPRIFTGITEYPLMVVLGCALLATKSEWIEIVKKPSTLLQPVAAGALAVLAGVAHAYFSLRVPTLVTVAPAMLVCYTVAEQPARLAAGVALILLAGLAQPDDGARLLHAERTFFGVYRVELDPRGRFHSLYHGTTLHGRESLDPATQMEPLLYYHREGPIGQVLTLRQQAGTLSRVAAVGLGTGSLAGYARPGEHWRFYEIDPAVDRIAHDDRYFKFLTRCSTACEVVLGDARLSLQREQGTSYDVIILDAFSSDAIPAHLLTREALAVYLARLAPGGVIAFHVSNRHLTLAPMLAALGRSDRLAVRGRMDVMSGGNPLGPTSAEWVVMARQLDDIAEVAADRRWMPINPRETAAWTDDFSNILALLSWK